MELFQPFCPCRVIIMGLAISLAVLARAPPCPGRLSYPFFWHGDHFKPWPVTGRGPQSPVYVKQREKELWTCAPAGGEVGRNKPGQTLSSNHGCLPVLHRALLILPEGARGSGKSAPGGDRNSGERQCQSKGQVAGMDGQNRDSPRLRRLPV